MSKSTGHSRSSSARTQPSCLNPPPRPRGDVNGQLDVWTSLKTALGLVLVIAASLAACSSSHEGARDSGAARGEVGTGGAKVGGGTSSPDASARGGAGGISTTGETAGTSCCGSPTGMDGAVSSGGAPGFGGGKGLGGAIGSGGASGIGGATYTGGAVGFGGVVGTGGAVGIDAPVVTSAGGTVGRDAAVTSQVVGCDGGDGCACPPINVTVLGKPGSLGANPGGDPDTALQQWLASSSAGTARVDNFTRRVTLTADFLATYNVIILASLSDDSNNGPFWTFSDTEVAAFQAWIQNGGGVISLIGYSGSGDEANPPNQLINFSGVSYNNNDAVLGTCADNQVCDCTHSDMVTDWNRSDPVIANLSTGVTWVGFMNGRSIAASADAHVAATIDGKNVLVGKVVGKGRALAFGDEWITYTSQWTGVGKPSTTDPSCQGDLPQDKYQIAQFWYNMIRWVQPGANCFTIFDTSNPITIW